MRFGGQAQFLVGELAQLQELLSREDTDDVSMFEAQYHQFIVAWLRKAEIHNNFRGKGDGYRGWRSQCRLVCRASSNRCQPVREDRTPGGNRLAESSNFGERLARIVQANSSGKADIRHERIMPFDTAVVLIPEGGEFTSFAPFAAADGMLFHGTHGRIPDHFVYETS